MTTKRKSVRRGFTWIELIVVIAIILVLFALMLPGIALPFYLVFGWITFLWRSSKEMTVNFGSLLWFVVGLCLLVALTHTTMRWWFALPGATGGTPAIPRWSFRRTVTLVSTVLALFVAGVCLVGMTHEVSWMATSKEPLFLANRNHHQRADSRNNLKQFGLAFHNYHDVTHELPAAITFNHVGQVRHGWVTQLLPDMDQQSLHATIRLDLPWSASENRPAFQKVIHGLTNPLLSRRYPQEETEYSTIDYAANSLVVQPGQSLSLSEIKDGTSNTLLAGEVATESQPWGKPRNTRDPRLGLNQSQHGFGSPFPSICQFVLADGSVKTIDEKIDPKVLEAIATPNGGEPVTDF